MIATIIATAGDIVKELRTAGVRLDVTDRGRCLGVTAIPAVTGLVRVTTFAPPGLYPHDRVTCHAIADLADDAIKVYPTNTCHQSAFDDAVFAANNGAGLGGVATGADSKGRIHRRIRLRGSINVVTVIIITTATTTSAKDEQDGESGE